MTEIGKKVHGYRIKHGLTQKEMATLCGLSSPTIIAIESEKYHRPNFRTLQKISSVLEDAKDETEQHEYSDL